MDPVTTAFAASPAVLVDSRLRLDRITDVVLSDAADGTLGLTTASGRQLVGRVSEPVPGVLRLELGADIGALDLARSRRSPLLVEDIGAAAALLREDRDAVGVEGPLLRWGRAGLQVGAFRSVAWGPTFIGPGAGLGPAVLAGAPEAGGGEAARWVLSAHLGPDDAIFGGGESFQGPDLRGRVRQMVNVDLFGSHLVPMAYLNVPFFWSDAGWGVFVNTGAPVRADLGCSLSSAAAVETCGAVLDVFIYNGDAPAIIDAHQKVTGRPGLVPEWALGVWTSRCSYVNAAQIEEVLDGYDRASCPVSVVHVDAWQTGNLMADFSTNWVLDRERFPQGWSKRLAGRGVRLSMWHNPYLRAGNPAGDEAIAKGYLLKDADGNPVATNDLSERFLVDLTNPEAAAWWQGLVAGLVASEGVDSMKADFGEEVPHAALAHDGRSGWEIRNEYALAYQARTSAAMSAVAERDGGATVMFCRSGCAGAQRYPGHWVGDTPSSWDGLQSALRACLSLSLSGFGVVASDVGGFFAERFSAVAAQAATSVESWMDPANYPPDVDGELFVRWTQWGALTPLMRFHGTGAREPWAYPEPYGALAVEACRMRERLRPYLQRAAREAAESGTPMMRPMPLAYPGDRAARDASLQYLLGPDILVAPVLEPGGSLRVWAPPGTWHPLGGPGSSPALQGPGWQDLELALEVVPAWVREGAAVLA